ncbi:hypothetical protein [Hoeflea prorocentri]|uniref:DUF2157 domain-containing protein n=1 Tax=Hoeflea prorocentri TaxID=1922333 RepID=A0A9X3UM41_9HYPH|nr:hypothetical protein [Hoeflea prorocentri]MCY6383152.1 hypothetical protein [Hoeflea prorocentri]MDA5400952.1 hypothetical protein [Hoeflea prorocentri]
MSLTSAHLDVAVDKNIITADQRAALLGLADEQTGSASHGSAREEEQFRFISGFNDVFLAIGVALFVSACVMSANIFSFSASSLAAAAVGMWLVSEILAVRMRRAIPSMIAALAFVGFTVTASHAFLTDPVRFGPGGLTQAYTVTIAAFFWATLYYVRFRLPFSVFMIGSSAVAIGFIAFMHLVSSGIETIEGFFKAQNLVAIYALVSGLIVFAIAMRIDRMDPERTSRKTDIAFWLHLLAAPLIVHALMYLATGIELGGLTTVVTLASAFWVIAIFVALSVVALVIDRRAILVAALTYLGGALWFIASSSRYASSNAELVSVLIIAIFVIGLGVGWHAIRRTLFRIPVLRSIEQTVLSKQV